MRRPTPLCTVSLILLFVFIFSASLRLPTSWRATAAPLNKAGNPAVTPNVRATNGLTSGGRNPGGSATTTAGQLQKSNSASGPRPSQVNSLLFPLSSRSTFLHTVNDVCPGYGEPPVGSLVIDLEANGIHEHDTIELVALGGFKFGTSLPDESNSTVAVFSANSTLLDSGLLHRVPGAIATDQPQFDTGTTYFGNEPTDIPEDFTVVPRVTVTVPTGARFLFVAPADGVYCDNSDPNNDYGMQINVRSGIAGRAIGENGNGIAGVTMTLSGSSTATATTDVNGGYSFAGLTAGGNYTVTPTKEGVTFYPGSKNFSNFTTNQTANFYTQFVEIVGLEVTQGIQNLRNDVHLIAERPTYVRVMAKIPTGGPIAVDARANLTGTRVGTFPFTQTQPQAGRIAINALRPSASFTFKLPGLGELPDWTSGAVNLELKVVGYALKCGAASDVSESCPKQISFNSPSVIPEIKFVPLTFEPSGQGIQNNAPDITEFSETYRRIMATSPVPTIKWDFTRTAFHLPKRQINTSRDFGDVLALMNQIRNDDGCGANCKRVYVGVLLDYVAGGEGTVGYANSNPDSMINNVGAFFFFPRGTANALVPSHEFGHLAGRTHSTGTLGPLTDDGYFGFDISDPVVGPRAIYAPNTEKLMNAIVAAGGVWPSEDIWEGMRQGLLHRFSASQTGAALGSIRPTANVGDDVLLVAGQISSGGQQGSLTSVKLAKATAPGPLPDPGNYAVQLEGALGQIISTNSFVPVPSSEGDSASFFLVLSAPADVARVSLLNNGQVLASKNASAHAPTVVLTSPNGGETLSGASATVTWFGSDTDGDQLSYDLLYSVDGGNHWQSVALNIDSTSYTIDLTALPGSTQSMFRVRVSDGFRTAEDRSDSFFTVAKHSPSAQINAALFNRTFVDAQQVVLDCMGFDAEDGLLQDSALTWSSDRDGPLGEGHTVTLNSSVLAAGYHTITLTARDSDNQTSNATTVIYVNRSPASPPLDDASFFVRQHYVDFLNREPDAAGLHFWVNNVESCGSNPSCQEVKRVDTSAAFYLSIEFQQTGYLVERMYKAAYGDGTETSTLGGTHQLSIPIVRLNEFLPDTQQIGRGVVVNQAGWEEALESNKQAFAAAFVQRSQFATAFPTTVSPSQFVDTLFANAGVIPSAADRSAAVNEFGSAADTSDLAARGRALRRVAENSTLATSEFNRAFVLMQYFGYLRRNPNDSQDTDYTGYDFWLRKLNEFNGNFQNAEMVKAFISSGEYRQRFGQ